MGNETRRGMRYKKDRMIFEESTMLLFLNAAEYADYRGISRSMVCDALRGDGWCKGFKIKYTCGFIGRFFNDNNYEKFKGMSTNAQ